MKKVIILLMIFTVPVGVYGGILQTELRIDANIPPILEYSVISDPTLDITDFEIEAGEAPRETVLSITSNMPDGFLIVFENEGNLSATATAGGMQVEIASRGHAQIAMPFTGSAPTTYHIDYVFYLNPDTQPGAYPWPIAITITPL